MFTYPATSMFRDGETCVVFSEEICAAKLTEGWQFEPTVEPSGALIVERPIVRRGK